MGDLFQNIKYIRKNERIKWVYYNKVMVIL